MELLEREKYLEELERTFNLLSEGRGFVVLISGEAGIGKTSLVETFLNKIEGKANILWGACDALFTPRPLGPLYDIAVQLKNGLLNLLKNQSSRTEIFQKLLEDIQNTKQPNCLIMEDIHWADESTLDLIKFLGRRTNQLNSIFIITYRDDELGPEHPLRLVLGDILSKNLIRLKLPPLTEKTVNDLADTYEVKNLFEITGGNPFLINELLSNKDEGVPATIKDSILTRISRLSVEAKNLIELISVIPTRVEKWLVDEVISPNLKLLDECFNSGILRLEDEAISFKHELSRMAVEESLSESKRQLLNEKVLQILLKQERIEDYLARIIHHAVRGHDKGTIIKYAADAARQASKLGAHRLAANHYQNALRFVDNLPIEKQLELYEGRSYECYLTSQVEEAIKAGEIILEILKKHPDPEREGENYRKMSRMFWYNCQDIKGEEYLDKAIQIFEALPPEKKLAMAYSNKSGIYMIRGNKDLAVKWGEKAINLARSLNDLDTEVHALNNIGCAKMAADDKTGEDYLIRSLQLSLQNVFFEHAARAYTNLGSCYLGQRNLSEADKYFATGLEYCNGQDLFTYGLCLVGHYAYAKLCLGKWEEAIELSNVILKRDDLASANSVIPLCVLGLIRARRNDPGFIELLDKSYSLAFEIGEMEKIVIVTAAKAEIFWLQNKLNDIIGEIESAFLKQKESNNIWNIGVFAYWLWKGNRLSEIPQNIAEPYLLQIKGEWKSAAKLWEKLNCPYEQAMALSEGDEAAMKHAIEIFESFGASAASQLIKQKMRKQGVKSIPKGPIKATRKNLAGLTTRQVEVLKLLGKGLSNNEIGNKLFISPKTVDHHISAILSKLNIHSRFEAAAFVNSNKSIKL